MAQRFVTNEPPTTQGGGVIQDPIRDPDKLRVPDPPVRKPPHDGRTPSIIDTPAPTFRRHGHESPPKLSGDDLSSARDSHHPEGDQPDKNQTGANKGDPAKFFAYLNN